MTKFHKYISDMERRRKLADALGYNPHYLWQVATLRRSASPRLAKRIESATSGEILRSDLRPDIFDVADAA